jgi:hypothetical protein
MRQFIYAAITLILLLTATGASSQERRFGLGIIIGEPTGISAKLWTSGRTALDFGLGWSVGGDRIGGRYDGYYTGESRVHFHMDYLWHSFDAIRSSERFPLYYGVGGRINTGAGYKNSAAVRGVLGILWLPRRTPIDVFLELVPSLQLVPSTGFGIDAGIGVRYFF